MSDAVTRAGQTEAYCATAARKPDSWTWPRPGLDQGALVCCGEVLERGLEEATWKLM